LVVHGIRVALELLFEPRVCTECEGWREEDPEAGTGEAAG
jgi:hypothetical protein